MHWLLLACATNTPLLPVPFGVDPKSVLCQFFKKGACEKGKKCKFSHDLDIERRAEKRSLYTDSAKDDNGEGAAGNGEAGAAGPKGENSADWDEAKLRSVVVSKHGNPKTTTDKVCNFFIEAVENGKYGWFWVCPNDAAAEEATKRGEKGAVTFGCKYRHSLPPGFVLKTKEQRAAEKALLDKSPLATLTLEDFLESERHKLSGTLTPVTPESFAKWKKERLDKKAAEDEARAMKEATGRALFEQGGWEASDDEDDEDGDDTDAAWMAQMRSETEAARERKEEERIAKQWGVGALPGAQTVVQVHDGDGEGSGAGPSANGSGSASVNGDA